MKKQANWNVKYMPDALGRCLKISEMNETQVNKAIKNSKINLRVIKKRMQLLYHRRMIQMHKKGNIEYKQRDVNLKIAQYLNIGSETFKPINEEVDRLKQILETALDFLDKGKSPDLIKAILEQARNDL
tara:strand:+ start:335 stop:721 length:387 start_codon:yes stop_codon:yes gene_type:complete